LSVSINKMKRILIISSEFPPQPGGIGKHAYHLATYLKAEGLEVKVIADVRSKAGKEERTFDDSNDFETIRIANKRPRIKMYLARLARSRRLALESDIVIATGKFSLWAGALLGALAKVKRIAIVHGTEVNFKNPLLRQSINFSLTRFDEVVAVSNYTKSLISHLDIQIRVIPNGVVVDRWRASHKPRARIEGCPKLVTVGNVTERKGQLNVIKHLPALLETFPKLYYHCIGITTNAEQFREEAKRLKVDGSLGFHGRLNETDLKETLQQADIFVMLSKETRTGDVEGFGIALLEANAMGVPVIGSKGCGIEDAIKGGYNGELIDYRKGDEFLKSISLILNERADYAENAKNWAKAHDWSRIIQDYLALMN